MKTVLLGLSNQQKHIQENSQFKKYFWKNRTKVKEENVNEEKEKEVKKKVEQYLKEYNFIISLCQQGDFQDPYLKSLAKFLAHSETQKDMLKLQD